MSRARTVLAVAHGRPYTVAARETGRKSAEGVAKLVARFNMYGLAALETRPGGRPPILYGAAERHRILDTARRPPVVRPSSARRPPDRAQDGTATWSLTTLQRVLRREPGLERLSTYTILSVLHDAGLTWQRDRTWCDTGAAQRQRKASVVVTTDPDTEAKKS
ncbi:helix-turn-helix domain-containing protein [Deinococcus marmoris]|uniref:helix-turn-helix domain-containing protein n=1 Tax=Deinococcus marmoris TaxID=249408 RepID=UPI0039F12A9E